MKANKGIYIALCLFVGSLGIHKFYAGKWGQGILYVLFCWTGLSLACALIDLIIAVFKPTDDQGYMYV
ncbi:TM2 domain-containing protein [Jeotgalibaca porci]|uniref:TM2 domain-containing protein n=1 Tax=Jeotgalibaca porci TaxID=1868793 RepID=UPI0035A17864